MGGDKFIVVCADTDRNAIPHVVGRVEDALNRPARIGHRMIELAASIGAAHATPGATDADLVLTQADQAMYETKRRRQASAA